MAPHALMHLTRLNNAICCGPWGAVPQRVFCHMPLERPAMSLPSIDFKAVREHDGTHAKGFEELCCQLTALEPRPPDSVHIRKGPGADAGVECFTRFADGRETGWQVKYFWKMDSSLTRELDKSIKTALARHPTLDTYVVCIPFDINDPRTGTKTKTALENWNAWKDKWIAQAAADGRSLDIQLWSAADLGERLTRDDSSYPGRLLYWFDTRHLTADWFRAQFDRTKADLGHRYTAETNVALDIRRAFLGLARDPGLSREVERWRAAITRASRDVLQDVRHFARHAATPAPTGLEPALEGLNAVLSRPNTDLTKPWPLETWNAALDAAIGATHPVSGWCFRVDTDQTKEGKQAHEQLQHTLWNLRNALYDMRTALRGALWSRVNDRAVLVYGDGGIGKSHLLADVTAYQLEKGRPALLLLGQHFTDGDPWPQIIKHLDLPAGTARDAFLGALDAAGQAAGVRALLLIDALNERQGARLWRDRLAGFLHDAARFPHIAVVLSCRTTYLNAVILDDLTEDRLPRLEHQGFGDDDARAYLKARHFVLPGTPFPAPEFGSPLFLKTCCDALEKDGVRAFPRGLRGTTALFGFYTSAVTKQINARLGLSDRRRIVPKAIDALASLMVEAGEERVPVDKVLDRFDKLLDSRGDRDRDLLTQLESEGLLTVEVGTRDDVSGDDAAEVVRFTFQRFSDHALATHLLDTHLDPAAPAQAFADGGSLHHLITNDRAWYLSGVLEAMAVQVPERCGTELPDAVPEGRVWWVREAFRDSLLWRDQTTFTRRTLELVGNLLGDHEVLPTLLRIATEPDNAFNAERLHNRLMPCPMPERDAHWSIEIAQIGEDTDGPVETLIDWAWTSGAEPMEDRRAELAGVTLTWLLTTSHRAVRDRATKALANLLTPRPALARALLDRFWDVDDDYLRERLLAAVYGAQLQGQWITDEIGAVAAHVHGLLFDPGPPPVNALLRDHGRGIIEYAVWRGCLPGGLDPDAARPPYLSPWPLGRVPDEVVDGYRRIGDDGAEFPDSITFSSAKDGDFARYVIDPHVSHWSPAPIGRATLPTDEEVWTEWLEAFERDASPEAQAALDHLLACKEAVARRERIEKVPFSKEDDELRVVIVEAGKISSEKTPEMKAEEQAVEAFRGAVPSDQWEDFRSRSGVWLRTGMFNASFGYGAARFDLSWARRWVCWRAHELGWSADLHQAFDGGPNVSPSRNAHRIERIGKKYQWLALYELGARLADNCAFIGDRYGDRRPGRYNGESFGSLRDLDPSLLLSGTHDDGWTDFEGPCWWAPIHPRLAALSPEDKMYWLHSDADWVDTDRCIDVVDPSGKRWLALKTFVMCRDRSSDSLTADERKTWARLSCFVVEKPAMKSTLEKTRNRVLTDPSAIPGMTVYAGHVYLGEYPWHPAWADLAEDTDFSVQGVSPTARPTIGKYFCEHGTHDASVSKTVNVTLPAPWLIEAIGLHLSDGRRATFDDAAGATRFFDPSLTSAGPQAGLVDREAFLAALDREGLVPVWVIAGEKVV